MSADFNATNFEEKKKNHPILLNFSTHQECSINNSKTETECSPKFLVTFQEFWKWLGILFALYIKTAMIKQINNQIN